METEQDTGERTVVMLSKSELAKQITALIAEHETALLRLGEVRGKLKILESLLLEPDVTVTVD